MTSNSNDLTSRSERIRQATIDSGHGWTILTILQDRDRALADGHLTFASSRPTDRGHDPQSKAKAAEHFIRQCVLYRVWPGAWNFTELIQEYEAPASQPGWHIVGYRLPITDDTKHYLQAGLPDGRGLSTDPEAAHI